MFVPDLQQNTVRVLEAMEVWVAKLVEVALEVWLDDLLAVPEGDEDRREVNVAAELRGKCQQ